MTNLIYQTDSYRQSFETTVSEVDVEARTVVLDQTAFYPGGGGQPADRGTLSVGDKVYEVKRARKNGPDIAHEITGDTLPAIGDAVTGQVDWERRYKLMRTHTALHVLCGVVFRDYGALVTGGNMEPLKGRMDFEFESMHKELVQEIEENINLEIANARDLKVASLPREEAFQIPDLIRTKINLLPEGITEIRTVEIEGLDLQADGGTHVRNTTEVGKLRVTDYKSKGRINKRIYLEIHD